MEWAWSSPPKLFVLAPNAADFTRWRLSLTLPRYAAVHLQDTLILAGREVAHMVDLVGGLDGADLALRRLLADVDRLGYEQSLVWCERRAQLAIAKLWWDYSHTTAPQMEDSVAAVSRVR